MLKLKHYKSIDWTYFVIYMIVIILKKLTFLIVNWI